MEQLVKEYKYALPPFCNWNPEEWKNKGHEYDEIRDNMLGWDITDFGLGDFDRAGFGLITEVKSRVVERGPNGGAQKVAETTWKFSSTFFKRWWGFGDKVPKV